MVRNANRYVQIIESIFFKHYRELDSGKFSTFVLWAGVASPERRDFELTDGKTALKSGQT